MPAQQAAGSAPVFIGGDNMGEDSHKNTPDSEKWDGKGEIDMIK